MPLLRVQSSHAIAVVALAFALAGCASSERLNDSEVRIGERPECRLASTRHEADELNRQPMLNDPCVDESLEIWNSEGREDDEMEVDFNHRDDDD